MNGLPEFISKRPRLLVGLGTIGLPVAYIVFRHIDWKTKPDAKKRMLISHGVFWPVAFAGIHLMHRGIKNWGKGPFHRQVLPWSLGAIATIIGAFEGGDRLAKWLVPKKPNPPMLPLAATPGDFYLPQAGLPVDGVQVPLSNAGMPFNRSLWTATPMVNRTSPYARVTYRPFY